MQSVYNRRPWLGPAVAAALGAILVPFPGAAQVGDEEWVDYGDGYVETGYVAEPGALTTRVWLDRGEEPVLERGDRARLYYRTSHDAYVALFHIDTNGTTRLLYPRSPDENHYVRGGRDFRLVFPESSYWIVSDDPGVGYFFALASPEPFDFRDVPYSPYGGGWDLTRVGRRVYRDPYVAMDEIVARLIPDWEYVPYALDFLSYSVDRRFEYPRFLCYDCHGFRPYASWNPYLASCTSFRVVVYTDPYYYPATRYRGTRVVYTRPVQPGLPRYEFKERARGEAAAPLVVERRASPSFDPRRGADPALRRADPRPSIAAPLRMAPSDERSRALPNRTRPTQVLPGGSRGAPGPVTGTRPPARAGGAPTPTTRPTLERRPDPTARTGPPATGGGGGTAPPTARPPTTRGGGGGAAPPTARPPTRSSGGATARPPTRSSGGGTARPPTRSSGGGTARPPTRSSGGGTARPPTRSSGGGTARPPTRRGGGG